MKIQLDRKQLLAALCTAAKEDIRYYLNGVYVQATATETRLTATDGRILSVQRQDAKGDNDVPGLVSLIVPRTNVDQVKGTKGLDPWLESNEDGSWNLCVDTSKIKFKPVDGKFPDFQRVIPASCSGDAGHYAPELMMQFVKAAKLLGVKAPSYAVWLKQNGIGSAWVGIRGHEYYSGVIMPFVPFSAAKKEVEPEIPAWSREALS